MQRWQYFITQPLGGFNQRQMDWYGDNGWELVAISPESVYFFKRPKLEAQCEAVEML